MRTGNSRIILSNCVIASSIHIHTAVLLKHLHHLRSHTEGCNNNVIVNQKMEALCRFDNRNVLFSSDDIRRLRNIFIDVVDRIRFD